MEIYRKRRSRYFDHETTKKPEHNAPAFFMPSEKPRKAAEAHHARHAHEPTPSRSARQESHRGPQETPSHGQTADRRRRRRRPSQPPPCRTASAAAPAPRSPSQRPAEAQERRHDRRHDPPSAARTTRPEDARRNRIEGPTPRHRQRIEGRQTTSTDPSRKRFKSPSEPPDRRPTRYTQRAVKRSEGHQKPPQRTSAPQESESQCRHPAGEHRRPRPEAANHKQSLYPTVMIG